jgi:lipopolysaccharide/colanic/teichoic acid biosynthesis glycosyltransferase
MEKIFFSTYLSWNPIKKRQIFLISCDLLACLAGGLAYGGLTRNTFTWIGLGSLIGGICFAIITCYIVGLYEDSRLNGRFCRNLLVAGSVSFGLCGVIWVGGQNSSEISGRFFLATSMTLGVMAGCRFVRANIGRHGATLAFLQEHPLVEPVLGELRKLPAPYYQIMFNGQGESNPVFQSPEHLFQSLNGNKLDILVAADSQTGFRVKSLLKQKGQQNTTVYELCDFYELITGKTLLSTEQKVARKVQEWSFSLKKRVFDVVLASAAIIVFALPALLIAIIIRLSSKGSVFFRQEKVGIRGKPITLIKFRSMVEGADVIHGLHAVTEKDDPRITPFGKILRYTHLDELPQLLMILKGDLSFIGPRPLNVHLEERLTDKIPHHSLRYLARPGLTGWAQINHPDSRSEGGQKERFQYDLFYIRHCSLLMDAFILLKSAKILLRGFGAR